MLSDPQSVTISGTPISLPRTGAGTGSGDFTSADSAYHLHVGHNGKNRTRRAFKLDVVKIAANPFDTTLNQRVSMGCTLVIDVPADGQGFTAEEVKDHVLGMIGQLTASSNAVLIKFIGGEA